MNVLGKVGIAMSDPNGPPSNTPNPWRYAGKGFELLGSILVFMLLGYWLDRKFEKIAPWGMVTGAVLGIIGGLYNLVRQSIHEVFGLPAKGVKSAKRSDVEAQREKEDAPDEHRPGT